MATDVVGAFFDHDRDDPLGTAGVDAGRGNAKTRAWLEGPGPHGNIPRPRDGGAVYSFGKHPFGRVCGDVEGS